MIYVFDGLLCGRTIELKDDRSAFTAFLDAHVRLWRTGVRQPLYFEVCNYTATYRSPSSNDQSC